MSKTAIIIGAGPAGLTAAYKLLTETDVKPVILEESDAIGGISRTVNYNGNRMDIGGHRFFSKDKEVNELWAHILPTQGAPAYDDKVLGREKPLVAGGPDPEVTDQVMLVRDRVSRIYFLKKFFKYPVSLSGETLKNMGFKNTMKAGFGYVWSCVHKKPEDNLANFYINRFGKPLYEMFFEDYTEKLWGVNPKYLSADWGAQRVKGLSLWKALANAITGPFKKKGGKVETSLIEQFVYPKKGPGQLWETLAEEIKSLGGEIRMNSSVKGINLGEGKVNSVTLADGTVVEGDYFISSMPIKDLVEGMGKDNVPADVYEVATTLPYRDFITVGLLVNKLQIKNRTKMKTLSNIVPDCWIYIQERDVKLGRLQIFNNWSPYMVEKPEDTVWIGLEYFCTEGDEMWEMSDEDFISFAKKELAHIGVIDEADVLDANRVRVKKAYPAYFGSYYKFDVVKNHLDTYENLFCVGRNGQHRYNNMDHSMVTAFEAAKCIKTGSTDRSAVWSVNTDKEYHEEKQEEKQA